MTTPSSRRAAMLVFSIKNFVTESNRIEGLRPARSHEIEAHHKFLSAPIVTVELLEAFVRHIAGAELRVQPGMDVRVAAHRPPPGGPKIRKALEELLASMGRLSPYEMHVAYEHLHPFMDGNGRSGRALWLHQMGGIDAAPLGFLHHFYYQALDASRAKRRSA